MEYRGYDSVGIATINDGKTILKKGVGKAHGGGIWLDKTYTTGASIKFTLPRDDVTQ
jgi:signal transduction histidine kinase